MPDDTNDLNQNTNSQPATDNPPTDTSNPLTPAADTQNAINEVVSEVAPQTDQEPTIETPSTEPTETSIPKPVVEETSGEAPPAPPTLEDQSLDFPPPPIDTTTPKEPEENKESEGASTNDLPPVVLPPKPKKKLGGKKLVATVLGLLVIVGGLGAGVVLVQRQQDIREKAYIPPPVEPTGTEASGGVTTCDQLSATGYECVPTNYTCDATGPFPGCGAGKKCGINCKAPGSTTPTQTTTPTTPSYCSISQRDPNAQPYPDYCDRSAPNTTSCTDKVEGSSCTIVNQCGGGTGTCVIIDGGLGANTECQCQSGTTAPPPTTAPPTTPPGGGISASCLNVRVYDTDWTELKGDDLKSVKVGDKIRFAVAGTASSGSFDKAKFVINNQVSPEVTAKNPSNEFYFEYTIPEGVSSFTIKAQIHHSSLGWSN